MPGADLLDGAGAAEEELADERVSAAAHEVFGARWSAVQTFAAVLAGAGATRGLIGPREIPRLWTRHLLNCAAVAPLIPSEARVVDVGSGAGLPGLVLALARPDLEIDLVEPMARRTAFLDEVVALLGLDASVRVHRGRADDGPIRAAVGGASVVTARAVAPLGRLMTWCLPLARPQGRVVALKGANAQTEAATHAQQIRSLGGDTPEVIELFTGAGLPATYAVQVRRRDRKTTTKRGT